MPKRFEPESSGRGKSGKRPTDSGAVTNPLILFSLLLLIPGCAARYEDIKWSGGRPGVTLERDSSDCREKAETAAKLQHMKSTGVAARLRAEQVYRECMMSRGYVQTEGPEHAVTTPHEVVAQARYKANRTCPPGVPPKVVQERLGHQSITITMDVYAHVLPSRQQEAAAKLGALLHG